MNIKINSLLCALIFTGSCLLAIEPNEINKIMKISKAFELKYGKSKTLSMFLHYNIEASKSKLFSAVVGRRDTLFLINQYSPVSGNIYCMAWNKRDTISYIAQMSILKIANDRIYNNVALDLISNWDADALKQFSKTPTLGIGKMYIARVVCDNNSYSVDCCSVYQQGDWQ